VIKPRHWGRSSNINRAVRVRRSRTAKPCLSTSPLRIGCPFHSILFQNGFPGNGPQRRRPFIFDARVCDPTVAPLPQTPGSLTSRFARTWQNRKQVEEYAANGASAGCTRHMNTRPRRRIRRCLSTSPSNSSAPSSCSPSVSSRPRRS